MTFISADELSYIYILTTINQARTVFVLRELEGLSYEEIAEQMNLRKGTVSSRLFYARQKLKDFVEKNEKEE